MSDIADFFVTVAFLVQSALLIWSGYAHHQCSRTIRKQAELIDVQRDLLRRQHLLLANILPEAGWKWTEVTTQGSICSPAQSRREAWACRTGRTAH